MAVLAQTHIVATPDTMSGAPRIDGHRIRVQDIVFWHLKQEQSIEEIVRDYDLTPAQVHSALAYYYDHLDEIEADICDQEKAAVELSERYPSRLEPKLIADLKRRHLG